MTDARPSDGYAIPLVDPRLNDGQGGWRCGTCRSADDWYDTLTDTCCHNCGTMVAHAWLGAYYAFVI